MADFSHLKIENFDATKVEQNDVIPAGKYRACITDSTIKQTKAGTGSYLMLTFQILDGEQQNRKLFTNLNLDNPNTQAVSIAKRELAGICTAVGVLNPNASEELHDKPMVITVACKDRRDQPGEKENRITKYEPLNSSTAAPVQRQPQAAATEPVGNPWKR